MKGTGSRSFIYMGPQCQTTFVCFVSPARYWLAETIVCRVFVRATRTGDNCDDGPGKAGNQAFDCAFSEPGTNDLMLSMTLQSITKVDSDDAGLTLLTCRNRHAHLLLALMITGPMTKLTANSGSDT